MLFVENGQMFPMRFLQNSSGGWCFFEKKGPAAGFEPSLSFMTFVDSSCILMVSFLKKKSHCSPKKAIIQVVRFNIAFLKSFFKNLFGNIRTGLFVTFWHFSGDTKLLSYLISKLSCLYLIDLEHSCSIPVYFYHFASNFRPSQS